MPNPDGWMLWLGASLVSAWSLLLYRATERWPHTRSRRRSPLRLGGAELIFALLVWFLLQSMAISGDPFQLRAEDVTDWPALVDRLANDGEKPTPNPARRIWVLLTPELRSAIQTSQATAGPTPQVESELAAGIQGMLARKDFYRAADFAEVPFLPEFRGILEKQPEEISERQILRLNRGLLEASFPGLVTPAVRRILASVTFRGLLVLLILPAGLHWLAKVPYWQLGLHGRHAGWYVGFGLVQFLVWMPVTIYLNLLVRSYVQQQTFHPALDFFSGPRVAMDWALLALSVALVAPMVEEFMFRALLQGWLVNRVGPRGGIFVTATLFGLAHSVSWPDPVPLVLLGIGLGIAYQRTGSLWAPVTLHALFNGMMLVAGAWEMAT